jgi:hypothetical protein
MPIAFSKPAPVASQSDQRHPEYEYETIDGQEYLVLKLLVNKVPVRKLKEDGSTTIHLVTGYSGKFKDNGGKGDEVAFESACVRLNVMLTATKKAK